MDTPFPVVLRTAPLYSATHARYVDSVAGAHCSAAEVVVPSGVQI